MDVLVALAVASCLALVATMVFLQLRMENATIQKRIIFTLFPFSQLVSGAILCWWLITIEGPEWMTLATSILMFICCPLDVILFARLGQAQDKELAELEVKILSEQLEAQREYNERLLEDAKSVSRIRDAARAELEGAEELLHADEENVSERLSEGLESADNASTRRFCSNLVLDALANAKYDECIEAGIDPRFSLDVPREIPGVSDLEACAVFMNLMDNAIRETRKGAHGGLGANAEHGSNAEHGDNSERIANAERPIVKASIALKGNMLTMGVENELPEASDVTPLENIDGSSVSIKRSDAQSAQIGKRAFRSIRDHGWGLSIVEGIAARHDGALTTKCEDGVFKASVLMMAGGHDAC